MTDRNHERDPPGTLGEARARGLVEDLIADLPGVVYRCRNDRRWTILELTPNVRELTGYSPEELLGHGSITYADLIHPADRDRIWERVQECLGRDEPFRIMYRIRDRSGRERWILEEGRELGPDGTEPGAVVLTGYLQDVTEPVEAQLRPLGSELDRARRQTRHLELLQGITAIVNTEHSLEAGVRLAIPEICRSLEFEVGHVFWAEGEAGDIIVSSDIWFLGTPGDGDDYEGFREATDSVAWDRGAGLPGRVLASGEPEWVEDLDANPAFLRVSESSGTPLRSGFAAPVVSGTRILAVIALFTAERRSRDTAIERLLQQIGVQLGRVWEREQQRSAQRRLEQLAEHLEGVFWMATPSGESLYVSPGIAEITGRGSGWAEATAVLDIMHPDDRPWVSELFADPERAPYEIEYRILRPDGEVRWIRQKAFPILNEKGRVDRIGGLTLDVTAQRRAHQSLEDTTRLLEKTVSSIEEAVLVVKPGEEDHSILEANPAAERMFGWTRDELLGESSEKLFPARRVYERFREEVVPGLETGEVVRTRFRLKRRDGTVFEAEQTLTLLDPGEGLEAGVVAVVRDVSEREEAEERFRLIAERIEDVFWMTTPGKDRMEYLSPAYEKIWGHPAEEVYEEPRRWIEAIHSDDRQRVIDWLPEQALGPSEAEYRIVRPDGEVRWIWDRSFPVEGAGGAVERVVGVAEDITERVRAEREIQERERRYRAFVENASDLISTLDREGRMMYQSPPLERLLGYRPEELQGGSVFDLIHPDDREEARLAWDQLVRDEGATLHLDAFRFRHADGSWGIWETTLTNLLHDPAVGAVLANSRDVTERVRMEESMRQSQRLEAIGRLAGGVAHDFNNLLTVIRSQTDLLLLDLEESDPAVPELEVIQSAADRAANLTAQLLAFSRDQILQPRVVSLCDVVGSMIDLVERVIGEDVRIETSLPGGLPTIKVDPAQLEQAVLNFAVNARDAMPGGGTFRLETFCEEVEESPAAEHRELTPGTYTVLRISDTGLGMNEETRARIFEPFFTTKGKTGGTGLGLSMVYGFVKQTGGTIEVDSAPGEGATFRIHFPAVEGEAEDLPSRSSRDVAVDLSTGTVLVIEDDPNVRRVVTRILERAGFDVVAAGDAEEGLEILDAGSRVDLVLSDLGLPGISGWDLAARVRESRPEIPIVMMSGYDAAASGDPVDLPGQYPFVPKPFTPDALVREVRRALGSA